MTFLTDRVPRRVELGGGDLKKTKQWSKVRRSAQVQLITVKLKVRSFILILDLVELRRELCLEPVCVCAIVYLTQLVNISRYLH